jgi:NAD(P)-dependent dehydrogenase (short-subunit alcohol dehydrogenase family)
MTAAGQRVATITGGSQGIDDACAKKAVAELTRD